MVGLTGWAENISAFFASKSSSSLVLGVVSEDEVLRVLNEEISGDGLTMTPLCLVS